MQLLLSSTKILAFNSTKLINITRTPTIHNLWSNMQLQKLINRSRPIPNLSVMNMMNLRQIIQSLLNQSSKNPLNQNIKNIQQLLNICRISLSMNRNIK